MGALDVKNGANGNIASGTGQPSFLKDEAYRYRIFSKATAFCYGILGRGNFSLFSGYPSIDIAGARWYDCKPVAGFLAEGRSFVLGTRISANCKWWRSGTIHPDRDIMIRAFDDETGLEESILLGV